MEYSVEHDVGKIISESMKLMETKISDLISGANYNKAETKTIYKQVKDDIFTVAICYTCVQILKQEGVLVGVRNEKIPRPEHLSFGSLND